MDKIIGIVVLFPMLISGLVLMPVDLSDGVVEKQICSAIEEKIDQQVEDAAVLINGENCIQTETLPSEPNYSEINGEGYNVKSGFVIDSETEGNYKAKAQSSATMESVGYNSLSGVFALCRDEATEEIRTKLALDSSLVGFGTNSKEEDFDFSFNHCRLGEKRYLVSYSGLSLEKIFEISRIWQSTQSYGDIISRTNDKLDFDTPYGKMRFIYSIDSEGYPTIQPHLYEVNPELQKSFFTKNRYYNAINTEVEKWAAKNDFPIENYQEKTRMGPDFEIWASIPSSALGSGNRTNMIFQLTDRGANPRWSPINNCIIENPKTPIEYEYDDFWALKYRETIEGGCLWEPLRLTTLPWNKNVPNIDIGFRGESTTEHQRCYPIRAGDPLENSCFLKTLVFETPEDFPSNDGITNVRYTVLESSHFDDLPMSNPEGGIDQDYADQVNICTNFSCIENKYSYPETNYNEYIENIEIREYMKDFPPFPEFPPYDGGGGGISSGFWELLGELVRYAIDTVRYAVSEFKDLVLDILIIILDSFGHIVDDFLEFGRWVVSLFVSADYDYEGLQLIINDAFVNSSGTVGVESFRNVFVSISDDWSNRAETNSCKVFLPEVESGFFKGFSVDVCGISEGIDWSLYRGLLSFVIILAALMTSVKMIYKMITLGKNPAREIVGSD